ncbi:hypothetical protein JYU34_003333 [Plutella xylostella]|uniref:Uncharacterized protein n=1 Tax=Plutella xylostella TaxID=51655 RepID=A0ABQ7QZS3_PLUXY|nr:hypothetical protein JYU34_003333 [Plutella xylostella]
MNIKIIIVITFLIVIVSEVSSEHPPLLYYRHMYLWFPQLTKHRGLALLFQLIKNYYVPTYWYDIGGWWRYDFGGRHALDKKAAREGIKILWKSIYNFYKSDAFFYPPRLRRNLYYNSFTYWTGRGWWFFGKI